MLVISNNHVHTHQCSIWNGNIFLDCYYKKHRTRSEDTVLDGYL